MQGPNRHSQEPRRRRSALPRGGWWLPLFLLLLFPGPAGAQAGEEAVAVAVAALPHIRHSLPTGPAALDPEAFCRAKLVGWACPAPLQRAVDALGFRLNSRTFVHVCLGGPQRCRLVGAESLVVLDEPTIERNTATMTARIWWRTEGGPLGERRVRLSLARRSGEWEVVRED